MTKNQHSKESGFTLIEVMLVLSIVAIMSVIIIPIGEKWIRTTEEEDAIQSLKITISSLQSYSMANNVYTKLKFEKVGDRTAYTILRPGVEELSTKFLPKDMYVLSSSNLKSVEFNGNGNIINFGALVLGTKTGIVRFTFQFQRGRVIISE